MVIFHRRRRMFQSLASQQHICFEKKVLSRCKLADLLRQIRWPPGYRSCFEATPRNRFWFETRGRLQRRSLWGRGPRRSSACIGTNIMTRNAVQYSHFGWKTNPIWLIFWDQLISIYIYNIYSHISVTISPSSHIKRNIKPHWSAGSPSVARDCPPRHPSCSYTAPQGAAEGPRVWPCLHENRVCDCIQVFYVMRLALLWYLRKF